MKAKINRTNISDHLVEYQLNMIGKTVLDVKDDPLWFHTNTMTSQQYEEFRAYAIPLLKKIFKFNKTRAEKTFGWFSLEFGLKISNN